MKNNNLVNATILRFKRSRELKENIADGLITTEPKTPRFYMLPKIHKENNPGRPVVSSVNCHTSKISKHVDYHLQPIVKEIPSYVKDTTDFLNKIKSIERLPENSIFVTMDVKSLYTNIPNSEGITAVRKAFDKSNTKTIATKVITTFMSLILTLNNFVFNSQNYLQIKGCAMGTICAPSYANIFMAEFEKQYIYPHIKNKSMMYLRYIDDIFMIWKGTRASLDQLLKDLNQIHPTIKFDYEISSDKVNFLDICVYKDPHNNLQTTVYRKPTDKLMYLHKKIITSKLIER